VKFDVTDAILLRADARVLVLPNYSAGGYSPDFEFLLGASYKWGPKADAPPPPPATPVDSDGDGLIDGEDQCPADPEDADGFQDADGCPELDNDGDGIGDDTDKCPTEPESVNGVDDEDGCPEQDEDGDGISGSADQCPTEAEDKDGFQDKDGCADPDNDGDGVLDAEDRCATEAETKNGYEDKDGCPDEIPAEIKKYTGVIPGIKFRKNASSIQRTSFKVLGESVRVLKDYPDLRILVEGHTSSEGDAALNRELSEKRAQSVKAYLVSAGINADRVEAKGLGHDRPIAPNATKKGREQNRRIEFRLLQQ